MEQSLAFSKFKTKAEAIKWVRRATREIGLGFHPDTRAADYLVLDSGSPLFSKAEAEAFDAAMSRAFELLGSMVYEPGLAIQSRILRGVRP